MTNSLRAEDPDDTPVAHRRHNEEKAVDDSQHLMHHWIGFFEGFPVRIDVVLEIRSCVPAIHSRLIPLNLSGLH